MGRKKTEKTSYEYFKIDEMFFVGKHRDYVDKLWKLNTIQESYFKRLVDLYAIAAIVGLKTGRKSQEERDESDIKRTVQMKQLNENYQTLLTVMRLVLIFDESRGMTLMKGWKALLRYQKMKKRISLIWSCLILMLEVESSIYMSILY